MLACLLTLCLATAVDGDTLKVNGERVRVHGIDTPELHRPRCEAERILAEAAKARAAELIRGGVRLELRGCGFYGRFLVRVELPDGRDLGQVLLDEGHARSLDGVRHSWCKD